MGDALDVMKEGVIGLVLVALVIAAMVLALTAFSEDVDQCLVVEGELLTFNSTSGTCYNASNNVTYANSFTAQYNATQEGLLGASNASSYLSTIGTLIGVAALISIVVMAFYFIRR
jgi:cobalamin synthase